MNTDKRLIVAIDVDTMEKVSKVTGRKYRLFDQNVDMIFEMKKGTVLPT